MLLVDRSDPALGVNAVPAYLHDHFQAGAHRARFRAPNVATAKAQVDDFAGTDPTAAWRSELGLGGAAIAGKLPAIVRLFLSRLIHLSGCSGLQRTRFRLPVDRRPLACSEVVLGAGSCRVDCLGE